MKLYTIDLKQIIPASINTVWEFFSDPHNLARITPPRLNLVVPEDTPHHLHPGMMITYKVRAVARISTTWVTEITQVLNKQLFVDEQRFGPYRFWHHQHHFIEIKEGIEVRDLIHYSLPLGSLGRLTHALAIQERLKEIFDYRIGAIRTAFAQKSSPQ